LKKELRDSLLNRYMCKGYSKLEIDKKISEIEDAYTKTYSVAEKQNIFSDEWYDTIIFLLDTIK
jgi:hypothetical protein